jgi:hypothetical protein
MSVIDLIIFAFLLFVTIAAIRVRLSLALMLFFLAPLGAEMLVFVSESFALVLTGQLEDVHLSSLPWAVLMAYLFFFPLALSPNGGSLRR